MDSAVKCLDLDDDLPVSKTLGIYWNAETDNLEVHVNVSHKPPTRRGILSMVSQLFDPLGFLQPCILPVKRLLQKTCQLGIDWDGVIPTDMLDLWSEWLQQLPLLEEMKIPRCFHARLEDAEYQLHCFTDASEKGYGAVCYLRLNHQQAAVCYFLLGKSRVAPSKSVTIPRLELAAAVVGVKLAQVILKEMDCKISRVLYWTDSTSVLQYISNTEKCFKTYVANRVATIHHYTDVSQWRHVRSELNPADIPSRGIMPAQLCSSNLWFNGPEFLSQDEHLWPPLPSIFSAPADDDPEVKRDSSSCHVACVDSTLETLFSRHSSFYKLKRVLCWIIRFGNNLLAKACTNVRVVELNTKANLSVPELNYAELQIIKVVRRHTFNDLITELQKQSASAADTPGCGPRPGPKFKQLSKLSPFLHEGVLRVGGRLQRSALAFEIKHPILLPNNHPVTRLIISFYHDREGHSGTLHVLHAIREKFWVTRGHSTVKHVLQSCVQCRRWKAKVGEQVMAPLPVCRVTPGKRPFHSVGIDYMGPLGVKQGRSILKRYACVFTCMATRSIHIEISHSLDSSSFLNAFRRFVCRRGCPREVFSDNGSNFVGAERELRLGINSLNSLQVNDAMMRDGIKWIFNPPAASHQGGVWERAIRTIRKILVRMTNDHIMTDEQLTTFMTEVERVINDRPITALSADPNDQRALSPSSILLGSLDTNQPFDQFCKADGFKKSWRAVQHLSDVFWKRWLKEYLPLLQQRQKWLTPTRNFKIGDLVLIKDENCRRGLWPKGVITETYPDRDGLVRRARIRTTGSTLDRDIRKLCLLESS